MNAQTITPQVTKKECRFVVYLPPFEEGASDYHFVKEIIHYDDGTTKPNLRAIANFQRDIWVTKKGFQNHQESKEWELVERLDKGRSTQSDLPRSCARLLGQSWMTGNLRAISSSPYLYGTDILSTSLIKQGYADKYPMVPTKYSVAVFDTETDVINGTGDIIIASITFKKKALVVVRADFLAGYTDVINRIRSCANKYIKEYLDKREVELEIRIVDTSFEIVKACFDKAHEWKPDFLAMWNIKFDVARVIEACQQAMVDPKEIFCDPSVPAQYKRFEFILGPEQKVTSSGKITPIKNEAQWHTVKCPSSFYIIDAMCVFKHNRIGEPDKPSYSLDNILNTVLGIRKLAFTETEHLKGLKKHQVMQSDYKFEYIVYNIFDCISVEELDEKTNDLSTVLPLFSGCSDFSKYNSQPRRTADELHFECMKLGYVIGTTGKNVAIDLDEETVDVAGWITALPAELVVDNGLCLIEEYPEMRTNIRIGTGDLDVSAAYPTNQVVMNVSKETTSKEITDIKNITKYSQKMHGINLSGGHTNAIEFCTGMLNFPELTVMLEEFNKSNGDSEIVTTV